MGFFLFFYLGFIATIKLNEEKFSILINIKYNLKIKTSWREYHILLCLI
jgi:hypothetical protein